MTLTPHAREALAADEERRQTPDFQLRLVLGAPSLGAIRDRGDILATIGDPFRVEWIRDQTLEYIEETFAPYRAQPGLTLYPLGDDASLVMGYAAVWRNGSGSIVGGASVLHGSRLRVPDHLQPLYEAYDAQRATPEQERAFMSWWNANHHRVEGGELDGIAVYRNADRDEARAAVRDIQLAAARHRVMRRLQFAHGPEKDVSFARAGAFALSSEGARSLNGQRARLALTSGAAQALVRNPDALEGLVTMPDTGRPLNRSEIIRGVMDLAHGGGEQFHIEAAAVKAALRPLVRDPVAWERTFRFELEPMPGVPFLRREIAPGGGARFHFEHATGDRSRLEVFNEPVGKEKRRLQDPQGRREGAGRGDGRARGPGEVPGGERQQVHAEASQALTRTPDPTVWRGIPTTTVTAHDVQSRQPRAGAPVPPPDVHDLSRTPKLPSR